MAKQYFMSVNMNRNQLQNRVIQVLAAAPASPVEGLEYYDSVSHTQMVYNGTAWIPSNAALLSGAIPNTALATNPLARANHTGTQLSATISDLATTVKAYTLDSFASPVANINMNGNTLINLSTSPSATGQAAEYSWVIGQISTLSASIQASVAGIDSKPSVAVVATTNLAAISGLQTVDGYTLQAGDRILLTGQTTATQNGPYVAAVGAWSRAADAITPQAFWFVEQGATGTGSQWKVSTTGVITTGTTSLTIGQFGATVSYTATNGVQLIGTQYSILLQTNSGLVLSTLGIAIDTAVVTRKFSATIGDGSSTSFVVTHNLNSADSTIRVRDIATNTEVGVESASTTVNTSTITFTGIVPAVNSYRVTIQA
jgi:hypothetical protein